jgi:putative membrane protein
MDAATVYDLVRDLHIGADLVFVFGLLAGLFMLAALSFHAEAALRKERRLVAAMLRVNRVVTGTALIVVWACGAWLAWRARWYASGWLQLKFALVFVLSGVHGAIGTTLRSAGAEPPRVPGRAWRVVPALALGAIVAVVWLALTKPF